MNKRQILASLNKIANELDLTGLHTEANTNMTKVEIINKLKELADYFESIENHREADRLTKMMEKMSKEIERENAKELAKETKTKSRVSEQTQNLYNLIAERYNLNLTQDMELIKRKLAELRSNYIRRRKIQPNLTIEEFVKGNTEKRTTGRKISDETQILYNLIAEKLGLDINKDIELIKRKLYNIRSNYINYKKRHPNITIEEYIAKDQEPVSDETKLTNPDLTLEESIKDTSTYTRRKLPEEKQKIYKLVAEKYNLDVHTDIESIRSKLHTEKIRYLSAKKKNPELTFEQFLERTKDEIKLPKQSPLENLSERTQNLYKLLAEKYNLDPVKDREILTNKLYNTRANVSKFKKSEPSLTIEEYIKRTTRKPNNVPTRTLSENTQNLINLLAEKLNLDPIDDLETLKRKLANVRSNIFQARKTEPNLSIEEYIKERLKPVRKSNSDKMIIKLSFIQKSQLMNKRQIIASLNKIANELDEASLYKEADVITNVMSKFASFMNPYLYATNGYPQFKEIFELLNTQDVNLSEVRDSCINYFNLHPWERQEYLDFRKDDPVIYKIITLLKNYMEDWNNSASKPLSPYDMEQIIENNFKSFLIHLRSGGKSDPFIPSVDKEEEPPITSKILED
jgi:histone H3/H4